MITAYFLRHTEYANPTKILHGRLPLPLTQAGQKHAKAIGRYFQDKKIRKIYSSAVYRCQQTAEIVYTSLHVPIKNDPRILEVLFAMQGMTQNEAHEHSDYPYTLVPQLGGESIQQVSDRMLDFFQHVVMKQKSNIIVCSHGDPLFFLYCYLKKISLAKVTKDMRSARVIVNGSLYPRKGSILPVSIDGKKITVGEFVFVQGRYVGM